jgi:hypothetical protein
MSEQPIVDRAILNLSTQNIDRQRLSTQRSHWGSPNSPALSLGQTEEFDGRTVKRMIASNNRVRMDPQAYAIARQFWSPDSQDAFGGGEIMDSQALELAHAVGARHAAKSYQLDSRLSQHTDSHQPSEREFRSAGYWKRCSVSFLLLFFVSLAGPCKAYGDVALLIEEPYGFFGSINPTGHSAIYLNRVCAETPIRLRRCKPDETGVVISRYSRIRNLDWVAVPLLPYLYAVEKAEDVPGWVEAATVETMRKEYAEAHLESLASPRQGYDEKNVWPQLLGVAYIRKIYSFAVATTEEQDDLLIGEYNERENHSHFNLFTNNCADFSKNLLDFYYPHAVHRSITADIAITTPKQVAKSLSAYAHHHDQLELNEIIIPQIPGTFSRSHTPRGVLESLLKTKKYALLIVVFHPYYLAGIAVAYLATGRFDLAKQAKAVGAPDQEQALISGKINLFADRLVTEAQEVRAQAVPEDFDFR